MRFGNERVIFVVTAKGVIFVVTAKGVVVAAL